jgi:exopolysaccharide biosynthesis WecB/TagA/CpsF family protein
MPRRIGAIDVEVLDGPAALASIHGLLTAREPRTVAFCNAHTVNLAARDPEFAAAMRETLVLNDGVGMDIASRWLYDAPFPTNLIGTDTTPAVLAGLTQPTRIFLLGSRSGIVERAASVITDRFSNARIVGCRHGFFGDSEDTSIAEAIRESGAELVLVGMGQPRQELWAARNRAAMDAVILCVGAYLDIAAGAVSRAPRWIRSARIEWVYRLAMEPRRLARRYLIGNIAFLLRAARQRRRSVSDATR